MRWRGRRIIFECLMCFRIPLMVYILCPWSFSRADSIYFMVLVVDLLLTLPSRSPFFLVMVPPFLQSKRRPNPSVMLGRGTSEKSSTSISVPTLPITEVDLSLVIRSASTLTPYGQSMGSSLPSTPGPSRPPSLVEEDVVISAITPAMIPLALPSCASAFASSHNSLESSFDPS